MKFCRRKHSSTHNTGFSLLLSLGSHLLHEILWDYPSCLPLLQWSWLCCPFWLDNSPHCSTSPQCVFVLPEIELTVSHMQSKQSATDLHSRALSALFTLPVGGSRGLLKQWSGDPAATWPLPVIFGQSAWLFNSWSQLLPGAFQDYQGYSPLLEYCTIISCLFSVSARLNNLVPGIISHISFFFPTWWKNDIMKCEGTQAFWYHLKFQYLSPSPHGFLTPTRGRDGGVEGELILVKATTWVRHYLRSWVFVLENKCGFGTVAGKANDCRAGAAACKQLTDPAA